MPDCRPRDLVLSGQPGLAGKPDFHLSSLEIDQAAWWQYSFPGSLLLLLAALWMLRRTGRTPLAAALFFLGTLFPVLGFLNVFPFIFSFVADHFQYLASLGIITLFSAGVALLLKRARRTGRIIGQIGCVALLALLFFLTWRQSRMYADIDTLYLTTIDRNPECWMAHNNLGLTLMAARTHVTRLLTITGRPWKSSPTTSRHNNLGPRLARRGPARRAIGHFRRALEISPDRPISTITSGMPWQGAGARRGDRTIPVGH